MSDAHLRRAGVTPGRRGFSSSPETFQSDLVDAEVERIMGDRDELADLLGKLLEVPPEIADVLALLIEESPTDAYGELTEDFVAADKAMTAVIEALVQKHYAKEVGL